MEKSNHASERLIPKIHKKKAFFYEHLIRYLFSLQFTKEKIILDVGCGVGYGSFIVSKYGKAKKVFGVDVSDKALKYAKQKYQISNIFFSQMNILNLKKSDFGNVDVVLAFEVIEHLKSQDKFLSSVKNVLNSDGIFLVSTPNKYTYPPGNNFHKKEFYPDEFRKLLEKYFKNVNILHQGFELAQSIKRQGEEVTISLEEKFNKSEQTLFYPKVDIKKSQYLIAVCSDSQISLGKLIAIAVPRVNQYDLTEGLVSLDKQFEDFVVHIHNLDAIISNLRAENEQLKKELKAIASSKFYKLLKIYHKLRF